MFRSEHLDPGRPNRVPSGQRRRNGGVRCRAQFYTTGMVLYWTPDVSAVGGATTLNATSLGATRIMLADGASDPGQGDMWRRDSTISGTMGVFSSL